ncbi:MAG: 2-aminoethylphosphonate--pyruvate transaminase [Gammaproteobacteria bacterium]|nr:MAG: 2-aminoethylphosphonate--pyruvate transaminase [Gammaproteobacteria bacterium]UCH39563.1 MAG: 2-aminoethylphosphonate--pyruvate transaminase [Gammaproteobacteria bacterium]
MTSENSSSASSPSGDPYLLTPGPLTTSLSVKQAMLHDYGSRDANFIDLNARILERLVDIVNGQGSHVSVPLQGSGTFVVEAMIGNFVPADGKLLILINGAYGQRIKKICDYYGRNYVVQETAEDVPVNPVQLDAALDNDTSISHVVVVHCETTSGILNPLKEVADIVAHHRRSLLIDSMSAFGALPLDATEVRFDAVVASSNKCLEGAPGMGFCVARESALVETEGNSPSLVLDLYDQWRAMQANRQWRFTPPTHVLLAFDQALTEYFEEGGVGGRGGRYRSNCDLLVTGMREMGFKTLLPDELQAPIIVTFHMPSNPEFDFEAFYDGLKQRGYVIYPGKLTVADSFRMGCIGRLDGEQIQGALDAVADMLRCFGIDRITQSE